MKQYSKIFISSLFFFLFVVSVAPLSGQNLETPSDKARCGIQYSKRISKNRCVCKAAYLYNKRRKKCIVANTWCSSFWAKGSKYLAKKKECACPRGKVLQEGNTASCVKDEVFEGSVTIDDSNLSEGSGQFDFETRTKSLSGADIYIGGLIINGSWTGAVDWQVVIMSQEFDAVKECPESGYANVDDPDGDGFGSPRAAYSGGVYCLKTSPGNYAKILVQAAYYDSEREWRVLTFKYAFRLGGNRTFP